MVVSHLIPIRFSKSATFNILFISFHSLNLPSFKCRLNQNTVFILLSISQYKANLNFTNPYGSVCTSVGLCLNISAITVGYFANFPTIYNAYTLAWLTCSFLTFITGPCGV